MDETGRKCLPHEPPLGVGVGGELFFITICAAERTAFPLLQNGIPQILLEAARHRHESGVWHIRLFLIMPDHVHALVRIPEEGSLRRPVADWKRWTSSKGGFTWQRDFFDHRLRSDESEREKADYILQNPVRAGLINDAETWPHQWIPEEQSR